MTKVTNLAVIHLIRTVRTIRIAFNGVTRILTYNAALDALEMNHDEYEFNITLHNGILTIYD